MKDNTDQKSAREISAKPAWASPKCCGGNDTPPYSHTMDCEIYPGMELYPPGAPRFFTWFNCKLQQMVTEGIRHDGKCHQCKEVVHLVELSAYDAVVAERDFCKTQWDLSCRHWESRCDSLAKELEQLKDAVQIAKREAFAFKDQRDELSASLERMTKELAEVRKEWGEAERRLHDRYAAELVERHEWREMAAKLAGVVERFCGDGLALMQDERNALNEYEALIKRGGG